MAWDQIGFSENLIRQDIQTQNNQLATDYSFSIADPSQFQQVLEFQEIDGSKIIGKITSRDKRLVIDLEHGSIVWNDNIVDRVKIGNIENEFGIQIINSFGKKVFSVIDSENVIALSDKNQFVIPLGEGGRQFTGNNTWTDINGSRFTVDGNLFIGSKVKFRILACVEVQGRRCSVRIYNITNNQPLEGSLISTIKQDSPDPFNNAEIVTSNELTFPLGPREYKMQFMQNSTGANGDNVQVLSTQLIYTVGN